MTPATIVQEARADGVRLALSTFGTIKASGDSAAVNRWVAVVRERKAEIIDALKVSPGDTLIASSWWLIHYPNSDPVETIFDPAVTHAELLKWNRDAIAAEPLVMSTPRLSAEAESAIRQWLVEIGEKDQTVIEGVLALSDFESHQWVLEQLEKMR
jgi:hypothetical protein